MDELPNDPLDVRSPNYNRKFANIHYMSDDTMEKGCIEVRESTTPEDVLFQYKIKFPKECNLFLKEVKESNQELLRTSGMSVLIQSCAAMGPYHCFAAEATTGSAASMWPTTADCSAGSSSTGAPPTQ